MGMGMGSAIECLISVGLVFVLCYCGQSRATSMRSRFQLANCTTQVMNRGFHSTGVKKMGGGHGHAHDEPYYLHAKHMYNLDRMKNQKLTMTLGVWTAVTIGIAVPVWAVFFQQKKTASG